MSFYLSLMFYRPRKPPVVTANDLAVVISHLADTGKLSSSGTFGAKIKFGDAIDADNKETICYEPQETGIIHVGEIEWDIASSTLKSAMEVMEMLSGNCERIYRANIFLGTP